MAHIFSSVNPDRRSIVAETTLSMIAITRLLTLSLCVVPLACTAQQAGPSLDLIRVPEGFEIRVFAGNLEDARSIRLGDEGVVFVSTRSLGSVYAVIDRDGDGRAETRHVVAEGLTLPNGLAYRDGALFVSDGTRIVRFDDIGMRLADPPEPVIVVDDLPGDAHHGWRYMDFGPDGRLYVSIGAPCNVCERPDPYAAIISMSADGTDRRVVARGVRNSVGFTWHPDDRSLWFSDNGRDRLGDDLPACEINRVSNEGEHFGFPYIHQGDTPDPEFGEGHDPANYVPPVVNLGAHVAPLGIEFYTGDMFPEAYRNVLFVAEHGSWNRSSKVGYRVTAVRFGPDGSVVAQEPFASGFLQGEEAWGRPVDLEHLADGSLLLSDDRMGVVYRISYSDPN